MRGDPASRNGYWFPAKRYGWGWGPPTSWQGWAVLVGSFAAIGAAALRWMPWQPGRFLGVVLIIVGVMVTICYAKGEPPAWRWGTRK